MNAWVAHSRSRNDEPLPGVSSKRMIAHGVTEMDGMKKKVDDGGMAHTLKAKMSSAYGHSSQVVSIACGFRLFGDQRFHHMVKCNQAVPVDASLF